MGLQQHGHNPRWRQVACIECLIQLVGNGGDVVLEAEHRTGIAVYLGLMRGGQAQNQCIKVAEDVPVLSNRESVFRSNAGDTPSQCFDFCSYQSWCVN